MPKFIIYVNSEAKEVFEGTENAALGRAHEIWLEEADQDYEVKPYSKKLAEEEGISDEE